MFAPSCSCVQHYMILISFCITLSCLHPSRNILTLSWMSNDCSWKRDDLIFLDGGMTQRQLQLGTRATLLNHTTDQTVTSNHWIPSLGSIKIARPATFKGALLSMSTDEQFLGQSMPWYIRGTQLLSPTPQNLWSSPSSIFVTAFMNLATNNEDGRNIRQEMHNCNNFFLSSLTRHNRHSNNTQQPDFED